MEFKKIRCKCCYGSGKVLGAGMVSQDCEECDGFGKIKVIDDEIVELEKLKSKHDESYNKAIGQIKELDPEMTDEKAKEIFDKEFAELEKEEKNIKRKK